MYKIFTPLILVSCLLAACSGTQKTTRSTSIQSLKFIGQLELPYDYTYANTAVGGLSGIDYNAAEGLYYIISDDRSDKNPIRFYTAKLFFTTSGIDSLRFTSVTYLQQPNGKLYASHKSNPRQSADPESIRYNPVAKKIIWSSEGERFIKNGDSVLQDPFVHVVSMNGNWEDSFLIPQNLHSTFIDKGPRRNGVFEGLAFANNFKTLYVSVEEPLYEDGPRVGLTDKNSFLRILQFNTLKKNCTAQFAYQPDPIAFAPVPADSFKINGVSEIMAVGNKQLVVVERSYSVGRLPCTIKLFLTDLSNATNVAGYTSLLNKPEIIPAKKTLLLNMDKLGFFIDNVEGICFGPRLANGHRTIVLVTDNNFSKIQKTQFLLFEVEE